MAQHISIRVPWHDNEWNGCVCNAPIYNNACLRLKNIYENRNDSIEDSLCCQCMKGHEMELPCISEGSAFLSPVDLKKTVIHPYKKKNQDTHGHFLETEITFPAYSLPARPYRWLMRDWIADNADIFNINYKFDKEPDLGFYTNWVQESMNHKAIFNYFYEDIIQDESICIAYAKQVPFVEDSRRVVIGLGNVLCVTMPIEHAHTNDKPLRSMTWEAMIKHSMKPDHKVGFVFPYQRMMKYAEEHPEFDITTITVFAPDDYFNEFSYATEHVSYDAVIEVILDSIKALRIINDCLDDDWSGVIIWLNSKLSEVWKDRGAFPGLGQMLCAFGMPLGIIMAKEIKAQIKEEIDLWLFVDDSIAAPDKYYSKEVAETISPILRNTWKKLPQERRTLFELLSRFSLSINQAYVLYNEDVREKEAIICTDFEIIQNPYILYEKTRKKIDDIYISIRKVDMAVFPVASLQKLYPVPKPTKLTSDNDERRVRALTVYFLEKAAQAGHTILPINHLLNEFNNMTIDPPCYITGDVLRAIHTFLEKEVISKDMADGSLIYKLARLQEMDDIIENRIRKRMNASRHEINENWKQIVDNEFGEKNKDSQDELLARQEKAAILEELAKSRIAVLVGDAGTGKTAILAILSKIPQIAAGGILLLAPTGKARVRMSQSMGKSAVNFKAYTVAQYLGKSKRYEYRTMQYTLSDIEQSEVPDTVIIDEASMLTEEMFATLMQALKRARRIIFVGDPNQLPPIGAGRPFVDLVRLLRKNLDPKAFPKVCSSYGELTIHRRQKSDVRRLDVELSKLFTSSAAEVDDDVFAEMNAGLNTEHIEYYKWTTKEEFEDTLLEVITKEIGMSNINDIDGFDESLGGSVTSSGTYFNMGNSKKIEEWQILAPVRNMPHGVMSINRLIHNRYRENYVELSKRGKFRKIPKMLGPENIVYGDKVINVTNIRKDSYPPENAMNYVANGEIGIAAGGFGKSSMLRYLHIEFSSQPGFSYSYDEKDFSEENGTANLELAYALTVHKAQGSQFNNVILVLSEPCRLISKELMYTALTRQIDKIVILYNEEAYRLRDYSSMRYSDIAQRFTDLFEKPRIVKVNDKFYEEGLIHRTARGEMVRSKSEVIIADCLYHNKLDYEYEAILELGGTIKRPDFKIIDSDTDEVWYWEHCGMMNNEKYRKRWEEKKNFYQSNGIVEGENLIVTYDDENGGLDSYAINNLVEKIFDL